MIEKEYLIETYEETKSINQTAKTLGISWDKCKKLLNSYGVSTYRSSNQYGECTNTECFSSIRTEEDAYWLGIMYADGWVRADRNEIGLGSIDRSMIEKFKTYTKTTNKIQIKVKDYRKGKSLPNGRKCQHSKKFYTLTFSSKATKENLRKLGCLPKKSLILQCPSQQQVSDKLLWHFLRGYIDGDGWIRYDTKKHRYEIGFLGTQNFLDELTNRLKIRHYGHLYKKDNTKATYTFSISKRELVEKVLLNLYSNSSIYLERKYLKCQGVFRA